MASSIPAPFVGGGQGGSGLHARVRVSWAPPFWPEDDAVTSAVESEAVPSAAGSEPTASVSAETGRFGGPAEPEAEEMVSRAEIADPEPEPVKSPGDTDEEDVEYPDYLFGPDQSRAAEVAPEVEAGEATFEDDEADETMQAPPSDPPNDVDTVVRRLLDGPQGERIRRLASEMTGLSPEEAIARAFAAGYLSGQDERDEEEVD